MQDIAAADGAVRRIRVNRKQRKPLEQQIAELKAELKNVCKESWRLRDVTIEMQRENDDFREENMRQKNTIIQYRVDTQKMEQDLETARKARDTVTKCYDQLLWEVSSLSEEWYDRHLDETGNILMKEPFGVEYT